MNDKWKRRIWRTAKILIIVYIAGGIILYFIQDLLLFHPTPLPMDHQFSFNQPFQELNIPVDDRNLNIVKFRTSASQKGIILFFHGNMLNVEHYSKYPSLFTRNGYDFWMIDYPGFGKSTGKRSEAILYNDALLLYKEAVKEIEKDSIIIYGKSIGTGVASYLASITQPKKLILETPYYSISALARHYLPIYPVSLLTKYSFPIHDFLKKIKSGVTIFHGTNDKVVPYQQATRLKKENNNIELVTIQDGRHNNLAGFEVFQKKLDSILKN